MDVVHSEIYKGHEIEIAYDEGVPCPFDDWDCEPPIAVNSDGITEYATKYGDVNSVPCPTMEQIIENSDQIIALVGSSVFVEAIRAQQDGEDLAESINEYIREMIDCSCTNSERLEALCDLYNMIGWPALLRTIRGYAQGDWAEVLAVATPEFQKACGNKKGFWDDPEKLRPSIDLFADWAYGNVYGYIINTLDEDGESNNDNVDSCWGFFGDYDENALVEAKSVVDGLVC